MTGWNGQQQMKVATGVSSTFIAFNILGGYELGAGVGTLSPSHVNSQATTHIVPLHSGFTYVIPWSASYPTLTIRQSTVSRSSGTSGSGGFFFTTASFAAFSQLPGLVGQVVNVEFKQ